MKFLGLFPLIIAQVAAQEPAIGIMDRILERDQGRIIVDAGARQARFSPDGKVLAILKNDHTILLRDLHGRPDRTLSLRSYATAWDWSPDGSRLAIGNDEGEIALLDIGAGTSRSVKAHGGHVLDAAFNHDGTRVVTAGASLEPSTAPYHWNGYSEVVLWDTASARRVKTLKKPGVIILQARFHPDGSRILFFLMKHNKNPLHRSEPRAILWDPDTGEEKILITQWAYPFTLSPDGKELLGLKFFNAPITLWDCDTGRSRNAFTDDVKFLYKAPAIGFSPYKFRSIAFSRDKSRILVAGGRQVIIWDRKAQKPVRTITHAENVDEASFSPDERRVVTVSGETVRTWKVDIGPEKIFQRIAGPMILNGAAKPEPRLPEESAEQRFRLNWDLFQIKFE